MSGALNEVHDIQARIAKECDDVKEMLLAKNRAYGNSALDPIRCFSKAPIDEQLKVRIDDKLSRMMRGMPDNEDVALDLIGYLILLRVSKQVVRDCDTCGHSREAHHGSLTYCEVKGCACIDFVDPT